MTKLNKIWTLAIHGHLAFFAVGSCMAYAQEPPSQPQSAMPATPPDTFTILRTGETLRLWQPCGQPGLLIETDPKGAVVLEIRLVPARCRENE